MNYSQWGEQSEEHEKPREGACCITRTGRIKQRQKTTEKYQCSPQKNPRRSHGQQEGTRAKQEQQQRHEKTIIRYLNAKKRANLFKGHESEAHAKHKRGGKKQQALLLSAR